MNRRILLVALFSVLWCPSMSAQVVTVSPGSIVRWPGTGLEKCGRGERTWTPFHGECWYAIDLLTAQGATRVIRWRHGQREERSIEVGEYPYDVQHIALKDDSQVNLSAEDLRRVERENRRIAGLWARQMPRQFSLPLGPPLADLPPGGRFGSRRFFNNQPHINCFLYRTYNKINT